MPGATPEVVARCDLAGRPGTTIYFEFPPASGDVPLLDESVPDESVLPGRFAVPSPLVPGVLAEPRDDWSGLLGAAGIVCPVGAVESPVVEPDCVPVAWPVPDELASGLVAADEPVFGSAAVWARAATDDTSAPAAKSGANLLLMDLPVV